MLFDSLVSIKSENIALLRKITKSFLKYWICFISSISLIHNSKKNYFIKFVLHIHFAQKKFNFGWFWVKKIWPIFPIYGQFSVNFFWLKINRNENSIKQSGYEEQYLWNIFFFSYVVEKLSSWSKFTSSKKI